MAEFGQTVVNLAIDKVDMTFRDMALLYILHFLKDKAIHRQVKGIAERLRWRKPVVTSVHKRLQGLGFVRSGQFGSDGRTCYLALTAKGEALIAKLEAGFPVRDAPPKPAPRLTVPRSNPVSPS